METSLSNILRESESSKMSLDAFVLEKVPPSYWSYDMSFGTTLITNYIEKILDADVQEVTLDSCIHSKALVLMKENITDFAVAIKAIESSPLESCQLSVRRTRKEPAVVVHDLDVAKLSANYICLLFETKFAEGKQIIESYYSWPEHKLAVFMFLQGYDEVVERILEMNKCLALPSEEYYISISPFYCHFHDSISSYEGGKTDLSRCEPQESSIDEISLKVDSSNTNTHILWDFRNVKKTEQANPPYESSPEQLGPELTNQEEFNKSKEEHIKEKVKVIITQCLPMKLWQAELLSHCFGQFNDCTIEYIRNDNVAKFVGPEQQGKELQFQVLQEMKKLQEEKVELTPVLYLLLSTPKGQLYLKNFNSNELNGARIFIQTNSLLVAAQDEQLLKAAVELVKERFYYKLFVHCESLVPENRLRNIECDWLVKVSQTSKSEICIEGIRDHVEMVKQEVENVGGRSSIIEQTFYVSGLTALYFHKYLEDEVKYRLKDVEVLNTRMTPANQFIVKFKGSKTEVHQALENLQDLKAQIVVKSWDGNSEFKTPADLMLIVYGLNSKDVKDRIEVFELKNKCLVIPKLPSGNSFIRSSSRRQKASIASSEFCRKPKRRIRIPDEGLATKKLIFSLSPTCQLVVKPYGNIIKENSDILVCILDPSRDLRKTKIGQAFNNACPMLWKSLKTDDQKNSSSSVLTTKGPFKEIKCKAICHVVLSPWNPNTSPAQLDNAVKSVLSQAVALGARSVSFPALGCGNVFHFPAASVAQILLSRIKSVNLGNILNKLLLVVPDAELFKELKKESRKIFASTSPFQLYGAVGGVALEENTKESVSDNSDLESDDNDENDDEETVQVELPSKFIIPSISLVVFNKAIDALWTDLKNEICKLCLHKDYFNQEIMNFWPRASCQAILEKAKTIHVWVAKSANPKTKKPGYLIVGEKGAVYKMKEFILQEFNRASHHMPKRRIVCSNMPKRGTVQFMRHATESDELFPSYWSLNTSKRFWNNLITSVKNIFMNKYLVDVDSRTFAAIKKVVLKTWDKDLVGKGVDARGLTHKIIKIVKIQRVENVKLFDTYKTQRKQLFQKMCSQHHICPDIAKLRYSKGRVATSEDLEDFMKEELYYEVNEHYLFHGTKKEFIPALIQNGIDPRVSSFESMFGKGIYTAESFTKSDQYTDSKRQRSAPGTKLKMILSRVLLGNVFVCDEHHKSITTGSKLNRPPCMHCKEDMCSCKNQTLFDSVMGQGMWLFREFVVYENSHCYPEYIITYQRI